MSSRYTTSPATPAEWEKSTPKKAVPGGAATTAIAWARAGPRRRVTTSVPNAAPPESLQWTLMVADSPVPEPALPQKEIALSPGVAPKPGKLLWVTPHPWAAVTSTCRLWLPPWASSVDRDTAAENHGTQVPSDPSRVAVSSGMSLVDGGSSPTTKSSTNRELPAVPVPLVSSRVTRAVPAGATTWAIACCHSSVRARTAA